MNRSRRSRLISSLRAVLFAVLWTYLLGAPARAAVRQVAIGPLEFDSSQELLSMLPTVDFNTGWVGPDPGAQAKLRLFLSPGYLKSHHQIYLMAAYDRDDIVPGGVLPVTFTGAAVGLDNNLRSGAGLITEAGWRTGSSMLFWISGDIPYLPQINMGYQAHVGEYWSLLPHEQFEDGSGVRKIGAESEVGGGLEIPLYTIPGAAEIYLALKPGLYFEHCFKDLRGKIAYRGFDRGAQDAEVLLVGSEFEGETFHLQLPQDLGGMDELQILLSAISYEDDLKIMPQIGFALGIEVGLGKEDEDEEADDSNQEDDGTDQGDSDSDQDDGASDEDSDDDEDQEDGEGGSGEPPDNYDDDYTFNFTSDAFNFGEVSLSLTSIGYETPVFVVNLGKAPGMGDLFQVGWDLPLNRCSGEAAIAIPPMPDLCVSSLTQNLEGTQVSFACTVDNEGQLDAGQFEVNWYLDGQSQPRWSDTVNALAEGGQTELSHSMVATDLGVGEHEIEVRVDDGVSSFPGQLTEYCEINNSAVVAMNLTLDLAATYSGISWDEGQTKPAVAGEMRPGNRFFVHGTVSRGVDDLAHPAVPVTLSAARCSSSETPDEAHFVIGHTEVDLSEQTEAQVTIPWCPAPGVDDHYTLMWDVDPWGSIEQSGTKENDTDSDMVHIYRPNPVCTGVSVEKGTGVSHWLPGTRTRWTVHLHNYSYTNAQNVLVRAFVAGNLYYANPGSPNEKMAAEARVDIEPGGDAAFSFERPYVRSDFGGDNSIPVRVEVDPLDEIEDMHDEDPASHVECCYVRPPRSVLRADLGRIDESFGAPFYAGEQVGLDLWASNLESEHSFGSNLGYPSGGVGEVPISVSAVSSNDGVTRESVLGRTTVPLPVGESASLEVTWRPEEPGQYLLVGRALSPPGYQFRQGESEDFTGLEDYLTDPVQWNNTDSVQVTVGYPRPDLTPSHLYVAEMPSRLDVRRIAGRMADAFGVGPAPGMILEEARDNLVAGAPVTLAVEIANPPVTADFPCVPAQNVRVDLYAYFSPDWDKLPGIVPHAEGQTPHGGLKWRWERLRDKVCPGIPRLVREEMYQSFYGLDAGVPLRLGVYHAPEAVRGLRPTGEGMPTALQAIKENVLGAYYIGGKILGRIENGGLVTFQWVPPHAGRWSFVVEVDNMDHVNERDETNNSRHIFERVVPAAHHYGNTPPLAVARVRRGKGLAMSGMAERLREQAARLDIEVPDREPLFRAGRVVEQVREDLRSEVARRAAKTRRFMRRQAIRIRQGETFTLVGSYTIDRERNDVFYAWSGPNVSYGGSEPNLTVDTSQAGYELEPGLHEYRLWVMDTGGMMHCDTTYVLVESGNARLPDLVPLALTWSPAEPAAGEKVLLMGVIQNQGAEMPRKFKVTFRDGRAEVKEVVFYKVSPGDCAEVFAYWTPSPGRHALSLHLDSAKRVREANERNNTIVRQLEIDGNAAPRARLERKEFSVRKGRAIFLDAYQSVDPDGEIVQYRWFVDGKLQAGQTGRRFRYKPSAVLRVHTVKLVAVDDGGKTDSVEATVNLVKDYGRPPVALAGRWVVVHQGKECVLPGGSSYDPDGRIVDHKWTLQGARGIRSNRPEFRFDTERVRPGRYVAELTVTDDDGYSGTAEVPVYVVRDPNRPPVVRCDRSVTVRKGQAAFFSAEESIDPDGKVETYLWLVPRTAQVGTGPRFKVRTEKLGVGRHAVVLVVSDDQGAVNSRALTVRVLPGKGQPQNMPPETGWEKIGPLSPEQIRRLEGKGQEGDRPGPRPPSGSKPLRDRKPGNLSDRELKELRRKR